MRDDTGEHGPELRRFCVYDIMRRERCHGGVAAGVRMRADPYRI